MAGALDDLGPALGHLRIEIERELLISDLRGATSVIEGTGSAVEA